MIHAVSGFCMGKTMKKIFALFFMLIVALSAAYSFGIFESNVVKSNDVPNEYEIYDTWYDGSPIIKDGEGVEYYLASSTVAYRIYEGESIWVDGERYKYCYDAEADVYIPMYGEDGDLEAELDGKTIEERIPYELDSTLIIPAGVDSLSLENFRGRNVSVNEGNEKYDVIDGALYDKTTKTLIYIDGSIGLKEFDIPEGIIGIGPHAVSLRNTSDTKSKMYIPSSVTHIDLNAFSRCSDWTLEFEEISPDADFCFIDGILYDKDCTQIIYIESAGSFYIGSSSVDLPDTIVSIPDDFASDVGRSFSIVIPESVTYIGSNAFAGEHHQTNYTLGSHSWSDSYYNRNTIYGDLPPALETIGVSAFKYADFEDGTITIPSSVSRISNVAFQGIIGVDSLEIPSTVKEIGKSAFSESSIRQITIADGVEVIEDNAFGNMPRLESINIPTSVKSIGEGIFAGSPNVEIEIDESCPVYAEIEAQYGNQIVEVIDWL